MVSRLSCGCADSTRDALLHEHWASERPQPRIRIDDPVLHRDGACGSGVRYLLEGTCASKAISVRTTARQRAKGSTQTRRPHGAIDWSSQATGYWSRLSTQFVLCIAQRNFAQRFAQCIEKPIAECVESQFILRGQQQRRGPSQDSLDNVCKVVCTIFSVRPCFSLTLCSTVINNDIRTIFQVFTRRYENSQHLEACKWTSVRLRSGSGSGSVEAYNSLVNTCQSASANENQSSKKIKGGWFSWKFSRVKPRRS